MEPDTQSPQVSSSTKTSKEASVAGSASSVRKEKRMKWWMENTEKRLGPLPATDGTAQSGPGRKEHNSDGKAKNPNYPPREMKRGTGKGKSVEVKKKQEKSFTIFVGQIPFDAKEEEVKKLFETAGAIKTFRWRINPETKKFKGFAFVEFDNKRSFARAFQLHHALVNGRKINVEATIVGGHKSKHRAEHIKDWTARMQKEGAEAVALKNAKKGDIITPDSSATGTTLPETTTTTADVTESADASKKRQNGKMREKNSVPNGNQMKKIKREGKFEEKPEENQEISAETHRESDRSWFQGKVNSFQKKRDTANEKGTMEGNDTQDLVAVNQKNAPLPLPSAVQNKPNETSRDQKEKGDFGSAGAAHPFVKRKPFSADDRPLVVCGVKPKESHLASLITPRLHIKFPE